MQGAEERRLRRMEQYAASLRAVSLSNGLSDGPLTLLRAMSLSNGR
jgi:hypothetical protein